MCKNKGGTAVSKEEILKKVMEIKEEMEKQYDLVNKAKEALDEYEYTYAKMERALYKILREEGKMSKGD